MWSANQDDMCWQLMVLSSLLSACTDRDTLNIHTSRYYMHGLTKAKKIQTRVHLMQRHICEPFADSAFQYNNRRSITTLQDSIIVKLCVLYSSQLQF